MKTPPSLNHVSLLFGTTPDRIRDQYRKNSLQLATMAEKARDSKTGKHNGYTEAELIRLSDKHRSLATQ
jgi:hypothetical protein